MNKLLKFIILYLFLTSIGCGYLWYSVKGTVPIFFITTDITNHRVMIWNIWPTINGERASVILGQSDENSGSSGVGPGHLNQPNSVTSDGSKIFVSDSVNNRVLVWNSMPTTTGRDADFVLGQPDFTQTTLNNGGTPSCAGCMNEPYGIYTDRARLFLVDRQNSRILIWNSIPSQTRQAADLVLGQVDLQSTGNGVTSQKFMRPTGIASDGLRLYLADLQNNRVLIWNSIPTSSNVPADIVLGQPSMVCSQANAAAGNCSGPVISSQSMTMPGGVCVDANHLFVTDRNNFRVLIWNSIPTQNQQPADIVLGQPNMSTAVSNNGGVSASSLSNALSISCGQNRLFVSDDTNNRVLIWNSIPTQNFQPADIVIGQSNMSSVGAGIGFSGMGVPRGSFSNAKYPGVYKSGGY